MVPLVIHGTFHVIQHSGLFVHIILELIANVQIRMEPIFVIVRILTIGMAQDVVIVLYHEIICYIKLHS